MFIEVKELVKEYLNEPGSKAGDSRIRVLDNLSFEVESGECLAFLGPNGAGKSTTIKILCGLLKPDGGEVKVAGLIPFNSRMKLAGKIGAVFAAFSNLWPDLSVRDNLNLSGNLYRLNHQMIQQSIGSLTELLGLADFFSQPVRTLSVGQRMRTEIAAALIHQPRLLFLDEPTIGLDVEAKENLRNYLCKLNEQGGVTIFLTSHDSEDICALCRRAIIINHGKIIFDNTVKYLRRNFQQCKIVDLKMAAGSVISTAGFPTGVKLLKQKRQGFKLEIDTGQTSVNDFVQQLAGIGMIDDLNISDLPLSTIIGKIYRRNLEIRFNSDAS